MISKNDNTFWEGQLQRFAAVTLQEATGLKQKKHNKLRLMVLNKMVKKINNVRVESYTQYFVYVNI